MKTGDIVRFAKWEEIDVADSKNWHNEPKPYFGTLIEHDKLMGVAHILFEGQVRKLRACFVEKAGKKDLLTTKEREDNEYKD